jgi:hypothetical protein
MLDTIRYWINHPVQAKGNRRARKIVKEKIAGILKGDLKDSPDHNFKHIFVYAQDDWAYPKTVKEADYYIDKVGLELGNMDWAVYKHELQLEKLRRDRQKLLRKEAAVKEHLENDETCNIMAH